MSNILTGMPPQQMETFRASVKQPSRARSKLRCLTRDGFITMASLLQRSRKGGFVRCLGGHYVFDDQRSAFDRLISKLRNVGDFINTNDLLEIMQGVVPLDGRYFHISFDDGLASVWRNGLPILSEQEVPATLFVNSAVVSPDSPDARDRWEYATNYAQPLSVMSWEQLRSAQRAGFEVGAHTRNHIRLSDISADPDRLEMEVAGCRRDIEDALGTPCRAFAWPFGTLGAIDRTAIEAIRNAGFAAGFGLMRAPIEVGYTSTLVIPRHHFEPQWPWRHVKFFAHGGLEQRCDLNKFGLSVSKI